MSHKYLPHFSRTIPAVFFMIRFLFKNILLLTIVTLTLFNYLTQLFPENEHYTETKLQFITDPKNYANQQNYYNYIINNIDPTTITDLLTRESLAKPAALGVTSTVSHDLEFWKDIVSKYPYYRDGYLYYGKALIATGDKKLGEKMIAKGLMLDTLYK